MSAEIEYIRITGMEYSAKQCLSCKQGWSQAGADRCSLCGANSYLEEVGSKVKMLICKPCPEGYYSEPGSIGENSCFSMRNCTVDDI
jgi:hypothetical protein